MDSWFSGRVDPGRWPDFGNPVVAKVERPPVRGGVVAGFDDAVVVWAQQDEVRQRRRTACPPGEDVVGVAVSGWFVAAGEHATTIALFECGPDGWGDQSLGASHVEDFRRPAEDDGHEVGVAQPPA